MISTSKFGILKSHLIQLSIVSFPYTSFKYFSRFLTDIFQGFSGIFVYLIQSSFLSSKNLTQLVSRQLFILVILFSLLVPDFVNIFTRARKSMLYFCEDFVPFNCLVIASDPFYRCNICAPTAREKAEKEQFHVLPNFELSSTVIM